MASSKKAGSRWLQRLIPRVPPREALFFAPPFAEAVDEPFLAVFFARPAFFAAGLPGPFLAVPFWALEDLVLAFFAASPFALPSAAASAAS